MAKKAAVLFLLPAVGLLMGASPFKANKWSAEAHADPELGQNGYVVQFPEEFGGQLVEMPILNAVYEIRFETERGRARVTKWYQEVGPIEIQGMSTGPITISLDTRLPRSGEYDPDGGEDRLGTATLRAGFKVEFDDSELRQIGLTSPFIMPAVETGKLYDDGVFELTADGTGELLGAPLLFSCVSTTKLKNIKFLDSEPQPRRASID